MSIGPFSCSRLIRRDGTGLQLGRSARVMALTNKIVKRNQQHHHVENEIGSCTTILIKLVYFPSTAEPVDNRPLHLYLQIKLTSSSFTTVLMKKSDVPFSGTVDANNWRLPSW